MKKYFTASISLIAILVFTLMAYAGDESEVRFPETGAGKQAESYFSAFNSNNENDMRTYLEQNIAPGTLKERPIEQRMAIYRQLKSDLLTLEPVKIIKESTDAIKLVARSAKESWLELTFEFEKSAPYKLLSIRIMRLDEPPDLNASTTPMTETEMLKELNTFWMGYQLKTSSPGWFCSPKEISRSYGKLMVWRAKNITSLTVWIRALTWVRSTNS